MTRRRLLTIAAALVVVAALGYTAWLALQVRASLQDADRGAQQLRAALDEPDDSQARNAAVESLQSAADSAADRTGGLWWSLLTHVPVVGDDAEAVQRLSKSLDLLADDGVPPLLSVMDALPTLQERGGRVDLDALTALRRPVADAQGAFDRAAALVAPVDSGALAGAVSSRFDPYVDQVSEARAALTSGETTLSVLPSILGQDGPRQYLLIFQNNAEIRATGGLAGSWALVDARDGRLRIERQGSAGDFPALDPTLPISDAERQVYQRQLGTFWVDAGFTPDFPRAAELWEAHWDRAFPDQPLDGVMTLDPVALSYLLDGTGPVDLEDGTQLTSANAVAQLLEKPYLTLEPDQQDLYFEASAKAIFDRLSGDVARPAALAAGFRRAAVEGRFLISLNNRDEAAELEGSRVLGDLTEDAGDTPHVDIGLNDATGSKMSYYLRYTADVDTRSCLDGRQQLSGSMSLRQTISPGAAAELPDSVTGGGNYGTEPGSQLLLVRLYSPFEGTLDQIRLNGKAVRVKSVEVDGRPVATLVVLLSTRERAVLTWEMETGPDQIGEVRLGMTPSVAPGNNDAVITSAC